VVSALYLANALAFLAVGRRGRRRLLWFLRASQLPRNWKRDLPKAFCRGFSDRIAGALSNSAAGLDSHRQEGFRFRWSAVVPNGIDTDEFFPAPEEGRDFRSRWAIPDDAPVIGMACRVDPVKGLSDALAVLQALRQEAFPGLRLLIAGGSGQRDRQALAKLARERGAEEALDLLGPVSDMRSFYNSLDALVLTSRAEGFPNAVAEAMACDIPVVATDVGDVREIVGELGHVAAPGDIQGLREGLEAVLGNPPGAGEAAASIRARYSKAAAADRFVAALEEAATQGKGP
jgi:glycosyltransferase involved in cell wall biosynthesis